MEGTCTVLIPCYHIIIVHKINMYYKCMYMCSVTLHYTHVMCSNCYILIHSIINITVVNLILRMLKK